MPPSNARVLMARNPKLPPAEKVDTRDLLPGFEPLFEPEEEKQFLFSTPWWATSILFKHCAFTGSIWEPACGEGRMSKCIEARMPGTKIVSTDLIDRGYGIGKIDFLTAPILLGDNIITNPPYSRTLPVAFVKHAIELRPLRCAFLLRTLFLETPRRAEMFQELPPLKVIIIGDRVMFDNTEKPGGFWCLSWFVWERDYEGPTLLEWDVWKEENCS